jgi:para-nitrobenzyl esterase
VKEAFPVEADAAEVLKLYQHANENEVAWSATELASDRFISYSTWKWFDLHRKNSSKPVYRYLYSKLRPPLVDQNKTAGLAGGTSDRKDAPKMPDAIGAPHACEIEYCMGNLYLVKDFAWTEDDFKVSETMLTYFANFIKNGDPNGDKLPQWPVAEPHDTTPAVMVIDVESKAVESKDQARYEFLDQYYKNKLSE